MMHLLRNVTTVSAMKRRGYFALTSAILRVPHVSGRKKVGIIRIGAANLTSAIAILRHVRNTCSNLPEIQLPNLDFQIKAMCNQSAKTISVPMARSENLTLKGAETPDFCSAGNGAPASV